MLVNQREYYVYITTNYKKTVLYTGVTNNLEQRMIEHYLERGKNNSFTSKYYAYYLLYYENFKYVNDAILREKEIKKWSRSKKESLITKFNPKFKFLNTELFDKWPPPDMYHRKNL